MSDKLNPLTAYDESYMSLPSSTETTLLDAEDLRFNYLFDTYGQKLVRFTKGGDGTNLKQISSIFKSIASDNYLFPEKTK